MRNCMMAAAGAFVALIGMAVGQETAHVAREDGIYHVGETVTFNVTMTTPGTFAVLKDGNKPTAQGAIQIDTKTVSTTLDGPGWVLLEIKTTGGTPAYAGAIVAPRDIKPAIAPPANFDSFWDGQVKALAKLPINAQVEKIDVDPTVDYFRVPTLVGVGLAGTVSPPSGVMTMANTLPGKVELILMPRGTLTERYEVFQKRYEI